VSFRDSRPLFRPWALALLFWPSLLPYPYVLDGAFCALVARRWSLGAALYRDVAEYRPPLTFLIWRVGIALFGREHAHVGLEILFEGVTLTALLAFAKRHWGVALASRAGLVLVATFVTVLTPTNTAETEIFCLPFIIATLAVAAAAQERFRLSSFTLLGFLAGSLGLLKIYPAALPLACAAWAVLESRLTGRRLALATGVFLLGLAAAVLPWLIWMWQEGILSSFLEVGREFAPGAAAPWHRYLSRPTGLLLVPAGLLLGLVKLLPEGVMAALVPVRLKGRMQPLDRLLLVMSGAALVLVAIQGKFYLYHFFLAVPSLALLAARWWGAVLESLPEAGQARRRAVLVALVLIGPILCAARRWGAAALYATGRETYESYLQMVEDPGGTSLAPQYRLQARLAAELAPGTRVLVWGEAPGLLLPGDLAPASRYVEFVPYAVRGAPPALLRSLVRALAERPPARVVMMAQLVDPMDLDREETARQIFDDCGLGEWLTAHYQRTTIDGPFELWLPRSAAQ